MTTQYPAFIRETLTQCKANPGRIAFIDNEGQNGSRRESTYGQMLEVIQRTCGYIQKNGIQPKSFVVINLRNSMEYVACEIGVWLAGCAIAPVSPMYPKARIDYIAGHCEAALTIDDAVLAQIKTAPKSENYGLSNDIAALYYTSGSTGAPKGVIHTFETLGRIDEFDCVSKINPDDVFGTAAPLSFIAGALMFPFLRAGAAIRFISREYMTDIRKLRDFFDSERITCTFISPSILKHMDFTGNNNIRFIITGTERVTDIKPGPGYKILNLYGMTETLPIACIFDIDKKYDNTPVGKPCPSLELKLMEDGEICLRGCLTPGYYKDPEKSAELWRGGWLHTGDVGRILPDGNLEYSNRKDWMIKINGQRVETGEIAQVIKEVKGVTDAVAKGFHAPDGHPYIVAYYTTDCNTGEQEIKSYLQTKLAPYMLPACYVKLDKFPVNFNGKIDVKSLQSPTELGTAQREIVAPETELQKQVCKAFEAALGISPLGIEDDFIAMGGDSIRVIQLQTLCPDLELSSDIIYRYRTPKAICEKIQAVTAEVKASRQESYPLSKTQEGIFAESMARRGQIAYNNPLLYKLSGAIDLEKLADACEKATANHPNLFARIYVDDSGKARQKYCPDQEKIKVEVITDEEFESLKSKLVQPFDLLADKLFRIRIFKTETSSYLFEDFHHIVFDGSSNGVLVEDIEAAYSGQDLKPEQTDGFELALQEENMLKSDFYQECKDWNLKEFCEVDQTTLPAPDIFADAISYASINTDTAISSEEFILAASTLGVSENILALAAFGYMLGACGHSKNAAFTTVYNGRKSLKTSRTVSMMVKTLPVTCNWDSKTSIEDYLKAVRAQVTGSMAHDLFSFSDICANTAFDSRVLFTFQDELLERNTFCGEPCTFASLLENATGEPLAVQLFKKDGKLSIRTEYRSNMFSERYIQGHIDCFLAILDSLLTAKKTDLTAKIRLTSAAEFEQILKVGKGKDLPYDTSSTFVSMFHECAVRTPDAIAIVDEKTKLTYRQLDEQSNALAARFITDGIEVEDYVALLLPREVCFPVAYTACFKAGAAYVPMDSEYPIERLQYMLEDSGAKVLVTTKEIFETKSKEGDLKAGSIIFMDEFTGSSQEFVNRAKPEGLAYMIYTSGTTGRPKGVMIEHRSLSNLIHWWHAQENIGPDTKVAQHASFSFDGSLPDLMVVLCYGGQLHILGSEVRKSLSGMYNYFNENKIDGITYTTQMGLTMLKMFDLKLRFMMMGGEKMAGKFNTKVHLYNGYGPTEFTVASSFHKVDTVNTPDNIPIGKAVPNTISAVVDSLGRPLPRGVEGELVLIGIQLARGYWHREDITAERFCACPFIPGQKMYRTGDLVKWDENGELLYLGRIDTQVKLRGFRIELGEIESTIRKFEGITSAAVAVKEIAGIQHLCAYYTARVEVDASALKAFCAQTLTEYMVPTAFVQLDDMPLTPNGKVDIKKLPVPEIKAEEIVAPEGELEEKLFDLAAAALGTKDFGVTSNLVSMGMTSLGAIGLSLQIEKSLNLKISSAKMLQSPTVRQWAADLCGNCDSGKVSAYAVQEDYPLTDNQTGIFIDWENHRNSTQYNVPMILKLCGVNPDSVKAAVEAFIAAHPYVNTTFKSSAGQLRQVRNGVKSIEVYVKEVAQEPSKAFFQTRIKPFDLFEGPLCRFEVYYLKDTCWLLSDFHHIIFDGGSEKIFASEVVSSLDGKNPDAETFCALDYSLYYENWKTTDEYSKAETYFSSLLEGTTSVAVPSTVVSENPAGCASVNFEVDRSGIRTLSRAAGVTENAFFLTAVTEVLHRLTRENNISILTVSNGRSLSELENTVGMFVQTLPVASHSTVRTIGEALQGMQHQISQTIAKDKFPFTKIVENCGVKTNVLVAYQGDVLGGTLCVGGRPVEMSGVAPDTAKIPVSINITPAKDTVSVQLEYDTALFNSSDIEVFGQALKAFAVNFAAAPLSSNIGNVACVDSVQAKNLIQTGTGETLAVDLTKTIVQSFREWVGKTPGKIAVVDESSSITYAQLDKMSDTLAAEYIARGISKDRFAALMLPRAKEYCIAYMAAFKAGGAYVPMDYEYPEERLEYMLEDSKAQVLVTTHSIFDSKNLKFDRIIFLDDLDLSIPAASADRSEPDGIAYMIYTSGTTGKPKGVMIEHHSLSNLVGWIKPLFGIESGTRVAEHPSFSFDASVIDLMGTIANGGELHILAEGIRKDPELLYKYICDNKIEGMCMSTQLGMMLMSSYKLPLRYMMLGGEKLTGKPTNGVKLFNGYGPTEFTVSSSYYIVDENNVPDNIPIGKAMPNTISAVVDQYGNLLPAGAAGELVLIGPQLARGYWNKPEISAQRFVECPFIAGEKMYHTGDLARWNPDGELLYIGRIDTQVKLRGFRIELGEIESVMAKFPGIKTAVAAVKEIGGAQHLCGYFTAASEIDTAALKKHLASCLTGYMVPDALMQMDAMPLTPNGKVNVKALPEPSLGAAASTDVFEAPDGERETAIANAFAEVLGTNEPIGRNSSFFLMGGTSLLVMKVIVKLSEQGANVTYGDVFKYPTPRTLAAFLDGLEAGSSSAPAKTEPDSEPAQDSIPQTGEDGYNYSAINGVLAHNTIGSIDIHTLEDHKVGDVLLLGATGYLGIHILHDILENTQNKIYCIIRPRKGITCEGRLRSYLMYYFDNTYASEFGKRIFVVEGDMTDDAVMAKMLEVHVDTVVNCAANVKHFAAGDEIEKINLGGAQRLIDYCMQSGSRLIQTSTHSISGQTESGQPHTMAESDLYFGQTLMTKYQTSKFQAERAILEACSRGLKAKIMRLGNLMPRDIDGEFQINVENNGFITRMRAYYLIGCIPSSHLHGALEFAPIDKTASAILTLARTPDEFTVFHPFNNHTVYIDDMVATMRECGLDIKVVTDAEFNERLGECLNNEALNPYITTLLAYGSHNNYLTNPPSLDFTVNVLNAMDWRWPVTGQRYLTDAIKKIQGLSFFDKI